MLSRENLQLVMLPWGTSGLVFFEWWIKNSCSGCVSLNCDMSRWSRTNALSVRCFGTTLLNFYEKEGNRRKKIFSLLNLHKKITICNEMIAPEILDQNLIIITALVVTAPKITNKCFNHKLISIFHNFHYLCRLWYFISRDSIQNTRRSKYPIKVKFRYLLSR